MAAGNPTLPAITNTRASQLQDTVHDGTGTLYIPHGVTPDDDPKHATHLTMWQHRMKGLLAGACAGMVVDLGGRDVGAFAVNYKRGAAALSFPGDDGTTLDASDDHYIYLDEDEVLEVNHVAFPADSYHLAYVETDANDITLLEDRRWENADVGGTNAWSAVAATQDVDMDDNSLEDVEGIDFTAPTELTIDAGVITPTQLFHTIDTEADAGVDDLITIAAVAGKQRWLVLLTEDPAHVVTIQDSVGNISLIDGNFQMSDADSMILLMQVNDTDWIEISRNRNSVLVLTGKMECVGEDIDDIGILSFRPSEITIDDGVVGITGSYHTVDTEADAATDDLNSIAGGGAEASLLYLCGANGLRTVVLKHGAGNINLARDTDFALDGGVETGILLQFRSAAWHEVCRSPASIEDLVDTARSIPYPLQFSGQNKTVALAAGVLDEWWFYCPYEMVIISATAYVVTVPAVNPCIVDLLDDGLSIFGADANCMVIPAAGHQDTSAVVNAVVAAGSILKCEIRATDGSPNAADHLTVSINAMIAPKAEP